MWSREYAAVPGATLSAAFDPADLARCYDRTPTGTRRGGFVSTDASSLRGDGFAFIGGYETDRGEFVTREANGFNGGEMATVVNAITLRAQAWGTPTAYGDQREEALLKALFQTRGIDFQSFTWTETSEDESMQYRTDTERVRGRWVHRR